MLKLDIDLKKRVFGLDILRALAILFVVIGHGIKILPNGNIIKRVSMYLDFDGVSIFFVLSGFLIGGILIRTLETQKVNLKTLFNFWVRRWMRTLPNYFFVLFLLVIILPLIYTGSIEDSLTKKINYVFFIQNFNTKHPYFFPEAWSLSIEEWFYLLIPAILFILIRVFKFNKKYIFLFVSVLIIGLTTYFRYYKFINLTDLSRKEWDFLFRKQVITRMDSLMYGVIGAYMAYYLKPFWIKYKIGFLLFGIFIFLFHKYFFIEYMGYNSLYVSVFSFSSIALATLMLLPFLSEYKLGKGFIFKAVTFVSLISYSMYLINLTVLQNYVMSMFSENLTEFTYLRYLCYWTILFIGSYLLYKYIELPFMKLRDKLI